MSGEPARDSGAAERVIRAAADALERDVDDVMRRFAAFLEHEIAEIPAGPAVRADTVRRGRAGTLIFLNALRRGDPPERVEPAGEAISYARTLAGRGVPLGVLLRIYYLALGFVIEALEERFDTAGNSDKTLLDATRKLTHYGFVLTDVWTGRMSDEYERARERWVHGAEELRREMITSVLAGHDVDTDAASKVLAYELRRHHLGAVLWVPPGDDQGATMLRLQTAAADIAAEVGPGRALILPQSPTRIWAWVGMSSTPADGAVEGLATRRRTDGVSVAIGEPDYGIAGFTRTHNDAADAAGVAALANFAAGRVTLYRSVRVAALFARDPDRTRRFVRGQLGSLAADDDESARLRATLMVYLEERGSRVATAERLGIHPNTVANRVRASRALLAHDLAESRVELRIALRLALALGSSVLDAAPVAR